MIVVVVAPGKGHPSPGGAGLSTSKNSPNNNDDNNNDNNQE
ncbi:hypothetical protein ACIRD3_39695 [Kitasatospora sp. NPDC093550]